LDENSVKFFAASLVLGLESFHDQLIVYRDLKPENILIKSNGYICLTDFGLSRLFKLRMPKDEHDKCLTGTDEYLAPETVIGKE